MTHPLLLFRQIVGMLPWCQLRFLFFGSVVSAQSIEIQRSSKRLEFSLLLDLASTLTSRTQASCIFLGKLVGLDPNSFVELGVIVVGLVK